MKTKKTKIDRPTMAMLKRGHRVTREEHDKFRHALANTYGRPFPSRMGRPPKGADKYVPVGLRLPPVVLAWVKALGKRRNMGYQTIITNILISRMKNRGIQ